MTRTHSKVALYKGQQVWFFTLLSILVALFALYVYFLANSVFEVVMRKEVERDIVSTSSYVGQLESEYARLQHGVNPALAQEGGYVVATNKIFIDRTDASLAYSRGQ